MTEDDARVFKALADSSRRFLLDLLFVRDGRTLTELESELEMTRFGVMKHLKVLEEAGLVVPRKSGREKLHFLNPVPIRLIHDRWIDKYTLQQVSALADLKAELERPMTTTRTVQVNRVYIKASAQTIWDAITKPEWTVKYGYQAPVEYDMRVGGAYRGLASEAMKEQGAPDVIIDGEVLEADPPHKLVQTWRMTYTGEPATTLTYELDEKEGGICCLTVTHDVTDAPQTAAQTGGMLEGHGGGWAEMLSDLKSLLETGKSMYA
ncbi:ArsR/SmtB family transcription factor [Kibdelosporangium phytohabitans]|uniref:ArsR family transcriptional regulator n=1 Tax=Kibdelosporangium phytohabitans TaxID=860235 RepID=A0A0N9HQ37_9PSEU|nr:SRPBCC domain-containing protein [Kibdelosporangium phytohabitans]ALG06778.1 ArsR family transcriptional regulator [Kibdelosporangium phytohabitans]MBE1468014.1 uncharacterized protein YndB with AHSA1/START domain/biotin operon repressor [Kibdelosporangium phytohabitans]